MKYRTFKGINEPSSLLGLGCMRFPCMEDGSPDIDESVRIIRRAVDEGITYFDTAYTYHGGMSEKILGRALEGGYRDRVLIADKMPMWMVKDRDHMERIFREQLERLGTGRIDMYLAHNIDADTWEVANRVDLFSFLEEIKEKGLVKHVGFSFHDSLDLFKEVIDRFSWDFCQIQLNYMDKDHQAGVKGLRYASEKGLGVVIMEPLKGGRITDSVPPQIQKLWDSAAVKRSPAEWAFRWLAEKPEVTVMLSGMSTMGQLENNLEIFSMDDLTILGDDEKALIDKVSAEYNRLIKYSCTGCSYCMPCPEGVDIPRVLRYLNDWNVYENNPKLKMEYTTWLAPSEKASSCVGCRACEKKCPQHLPISTAMKEMVGTMGE